MGEYSNTHGYTIEYDLYSYGCTDHHQLKIWTKKLKSKLHLRQWEEDQMSFPLANLFWQSNHGRFIQQNLSAKPCPEKHDKIKIGQILLISKSSPTQNKNKTSQTTHSKY